MALTYFDTCVWLSAFFTHNPNHGKAITTFNKIKNDKDTIIVTHHLLNEIFDVLKNQCNVALKDAGKAERETKNLYQQFSGNLMAMPNVIIKNPNISCHNLFTPVFSLLFKYSKGIAFSFNCPICHKRYNYVETDTIFRDDAIHAILAWALNCDIFFTFDKDFYQMSNDPLISPLKINVIH